MHTHGVTRAGSVQPKVPTTAAERAAAHAELATENEALAKQLAAETMDKEALTRQLTQETKDKEALAMQLAATIKDKEALAMQLVAMTKQLTQETKDKEALASQLAAMVAQSANQPGEAVAAGAEGLQLSGTPCTLPKGARTHANRHCCRG